MRGSRRCSFNRRGRGAGKAVSCSPRSASRRSRCPQPRGAPGALLDRAAQPPSLGAPPAPVSACVCTRARFYLSGWPVAAACRVRLVTQPLWTLHSPVPGPVPGSLLFYPTRVRNPNR
ncbi:unnamed protein product [Rangifer tarandus platyrhynchus]|uniref:Uncharacterized protein n=1 Tax=Rangifer tarandus platyrhynchus TaxID=3082113 RepID=A0AC59YBE5_RANTA